MAVITALVLGAKAKAAEQFPPANSEDPYYGVDKTVKYGEKYKCEITTVEGKNYTLDIGWSAEQDLMSKLPRETKQIYFELADLNTQKVVKDAFSQTIYLDYSTSLGNVQIVKGANSFKYSIVGDDYYSAHGKKIDLNIAASKCEQQFDPE